jgi:SAM-dependent methyltransferase
MTQNSAPRPFIIREGWMARLWLAALPGALLFSMPFYFMLPLAAPEAVKAGAALALGTAASLLLVYRQKREHLARHIAEAELLGFGWTVKGCLWNPAGAPELRLNLPPGDPEEDRLLAGLVKISGHPYGHARRLLRRAGGPALGAAAVMALVLGKAPGLMPLLTPLFGLAALVFLLSWGEALFARLERGLSTAEALSAFSPESSYLQWNLLSLEAKREAAGRVPAMRETISRVLRGEAGLSSGSAVLEVGAAGGFLWKHIPEELRANWTQAERDPHACLYARRHGNGVRWQLADVKSLPFPDASFDAVVGLECFDSLSLEDLGRFLAEAARVLKPGGRLVHLKDFPDWPGTALAGRFNAFGLRALRLEPVSLDRKLNLGFAPLDAADIEELARAAGRATGPTAPYARVLAAIYSAGADSDRRFRLPMFVSALALRETFLDAGFEPVSDSLGPDAGRPEVMAHIVARRPA